MIQTHDLLIGKPTLKPLCYGHYPVPGIILLIVAHYAKRTSEEESLSPFDVKKQQTYFGLKMRPFMLHVCCGLLGLLQALFLSAALCQRPRNYLSCSSCSPFGSFPH